LRDDCLEDAMIKTIKRLWKDRRGNVLAITGAAIPLVVGSAGLATDTIQWATWKRELQRAADSGAYAGVYSTAQGAATADAAVNRDFTKNNISGISLLSGYPQIAYPTSANWTNGVRVTLAIRKQLSFSSMFMSAAPTITATATAAMIPNGKYCVVALESGTNAGITIGGSANVNLGCGVISNSISVDDSIDTNGNDYTLNAEPVAASGGLDVASLSTHGASDIQPYHMPQLDPYDDMYDTSIPASVTCKNNVNSGTVAGVVQPGCYNNFNLGPGTTNLAPGVYYLNNTDLSMSGNQVLRGDGVTIILTGTDPGSVQINGNSVIDISAPNDSNCGTFGGVNSCDFKNMLIIQSENADAANANLINGNNGSNLDGAIYFPNGALTFTGSATGTTQCAMIVAKRVDFSGNNEIQNDTSGCDSDSQVDAFTVKLVA
jgi:Flp pilus assembly protein TadG